MDQTVRIKLGRLLNSFFLSGIILSGVSCASPIVTSPAVQFEESKFATNNPDRGLFDQILSRETLRFSFKSSSYRNHRVYIQLTRFLSGPIPPFELRNLEDSLKEATHDRRRIIIRFMYDWPTEEDVKSGLTIRHATTPSPEIITQHLAQIIPIVAQNSTAVFAIESGMIGFWGEQHGDTSYKQSPAFLATIVNAWRTGLIGLNIPILIRYPQALRDYLDLGYQLPSGAPPVGLWNDCLAAHDDKAIENSGERTTHVYEGETCVLKPRYDYSCATMTRYFSKIGIGLIHANYYGPTIDQWKRDGCFEEIQSKLGYRLVIRNAIVNSTADTIIIQIDNIGWGRSVVSRPLYLISGDYKVKPVADLADFTAGSKNLIEIRLDNRLDPSQPLSLETDDGVQFSNKFGNLLGMPRNLQPR